MRVRALCLPLRLLLLLGIALSISAAVAGAAIEQQATIVTVAGSGIDAHTGDGGPALAAAIAHPRGVAFLRDGSFVFAEPFANTVRRVAPDGTITTIAGTGETGYSGDGGPATSARLFLAHGVAELSDGSLLVADAGNNRIRRIADGIITTVAGTGERGFSGDGGPAVAARIDNPRGVAVLPGGGFLIPDTDNHRVRRVDANGTITTVAGTGTPGFSGDGGAAVDAQLRRPFGVASTADGGFLVVDVGNQRIRRVSRDGVITTVAGTGVNGFSGDAGPARSAELDNPHNVAALPDGGFLIADTFNNRVRRVSPTGVITTVAGTGAAGFSDGDGSAATAELDLPKALAVLPDRSGFLVGDSANNRVRLVRIDLRPALVLRLARASTASRVGRTVTVRYSVSDAAQVSLLVDRGKRTAYRASAHASAGSNGFSFGRSLTIGRYRVRLVARTSDGRRSSAAATLRIVR